MRTRAGGRRSTVVAAAVAVLVALGATPALADDPFGPAFDLSDHTDRVGGYDLASDQQGDDLAVWSIGTGESGEQMVVQASFRPAGGAFGPVVRLSTLPRSAVGPRVAFDARGDATVSFEQDDQVEVVDRPAGGRFGAPVTVPGMTGSDVGPVELAMDGVGDATVGVDDSGSYDIPEVQVATRPAGGAFGDFRRVSPDGVPTGLGGLTANARGDRALTWVEHPAQQAEPLVAYVTRAAAGADFAAPIRVSDPTQDADAGPPVLDATGSATVFFSASADRGSSYAIHAADVPPVGGVTADQVLEPSAEGVRGASAVVDGAGRVTAVWTGPGAAPGLTAIRSATAPSGQPFAPSTVLDEVSGGSTDATIAVDPSGAVSVGWPRRAAPDDRDLDRERVVTRPAGAATFGAPQDVAGLRTGIEGAVLAAGPSSSLALLLDAGATYDDELEAALTAAPPVPQAPVAPDPAPAAATAAPGDGAAAPAGPASAGATPVGPADGVHLPATRLRLALLRTEGIELTCTLHAAGRCSAAATVTPATAVALRLTHRRATRPVVVATGSAAVTAPGSRTFHVRLTAATRRALRSLSRSVTVTVSATGTFAASRSSVGSADLVVSR